MNNNENAGYRQTLDYFSDLLDRQIDRVKSYDIEKALALGTEATEVAAQIGRAGILHLPEFASYQSVIDAKYKQLNLIIEAHRSQISDKMDQIRQTKTALGAYKHSLGV